MDIALYLDLKSFLCTILTKQQAHTIAGLHERAILVETQNNNTQHIEQEKNIYPYSLSIYGETKKKEM